MQSGAADYLRKPFDVEELTFKLVRALERQLLRRTVTRFRDQRPPIPTGTHPAWRRAVEAATHELDVQLVGEVGSGRATVGRYAHAEHQRDCQARHPESWPGISSTHHDDDAPGRRILGRCAAARAYYSAHTGAWLRA